MNSTPDHNNNQSNSQEGTDKNSFIPPKLTSTIKLLLKADPDHILAKGYIEKKKEYDQKFSKFISELEVKKREELPELRPLEIENLYQSFKDAFKAFRGVEFNDQLNKTGENKYGEGGILARTICLYLLKDRNFHKSPILNKELNTPNLGKGCLLVGEMGTGKSSIMKTFYDMFLYATTHKIMVKDIDGTDQYLSRYKLGFKFFNCHEVVQDYHASAREKNKEHEEIFWKKHKSGLSYYDDLMTEKKAFGKDELFTEILETKYNNTCPSIVSLNYVGKNIIYEITNESKHVCDIETTLDALELKYGSRMYDRIFEMYNIIELKGKSLRK